MRESCSRWGSLFYGNAPLTGIYMFFSETPQWSLKGRIPRSSRGGSAEVDLGRALSKRSNSAPSSESAGHTLPSLFLNSSLSLMPIMSVLLEHTRWISSLPSFRSFPPSLSLTVPSFFLCFVHYSLSSFPFGCIPLRLS